MPQASGTPSTAGILAGILAVVSLFAASIGQVQACYVHSGQYQGLRVSHALSIPVSVATRRAIVAGDLTDIPRATEEQRKNALRRLTSVFTLFSQRSDGRTGDPGPSFSVFLTESGFWTRFAPDPTGGWRAQPHRSGPAEKDVVILASDPAMAALLKGDIGINQASRLGLLATDGQGRDIDASLRQLGDFIRSFSRSGMARFDLNRPVPGISFARPIGR